MIPGGVLVFVIADLLARSGPNAFLDISNARGPFQRVCVYEFQWEAERGLGRHQLELSRASARSGECVHKKVSAGLLGIPWRPKQNVNWVYANSWMPAHSSRQPS